MFEQVNLRLVGLKNRKFSFCQILFVNFKINSIDCILTRSKKSCEKFLLIVDDFQDDLLLPLYFEYSFLFADCSFYFSIKKKTMSDDALIHS